MSVWALTHIKLEQQRGLCCLFSGKAVSMKSDMSCQIK